MCKDWRVNRRLTYGTNWVRRYFKKSSPSTHATVHDRSAGASASATHTDRPTVTQVTNSQGASKAGNEARPNRFTTPS